MILFFLGREHHAEKLVDLATAFGDTGYLIADNAINIDPPSMFIADYGLQNVVHLSTFFRGEREELLSYNDIPEGIKQSVAPFWLAYSLEEASRTTTAIKRCLSEIKPEAVFLLHLNNFWASQIAQAAQQMGVPVFTLQEGIILDREVSIAGKYEAATRYADYVFSWSNDDKEKYTEKHKIVPVGAPHLVKWLNKPKSPQRFAFLPPRLDLYMGDFGKDLHALCKQIDRMPGAELFVKFHPYDNVSENILHQYAKCSTWRGGTYELLSGARRVVTQISTVALEAVALGCETVVIDSQYVGIGNGIPCPAIHNITDAAGDIGFTAQQQWLKQNSILTDGLAIKRIVDFTRNKMA